MKTRTERFRDAVHKKMRQARSVWERQMWKELLHHGAPYTSQELRAKIQEAQSVAERQFYEGLRDEPIRY